MKECPECSMFNGSNDTKCKYCGANLGSGTGGLGTSAPEKKKEDPKAKEAREKEEKKKKLITYVGYGLIAAAAVGWLVYTYWKKSKEPPPEAEPAAEVVEGEEQTDETIEESVVERPAGVEEAIPKLGKRVALDSFSLTPFDKAIIEGPGDGADPDTSKLFSAASKDGTVTMAVRQIALSADDKDLTGALGAKLQAEYITAKGKFVAMPGKKQGKTALGDFIMFEADLGDTFERAYYILTADAMLEMVFVYPAKDKKTGKHEAMIDEIFSSIKKPKAAAPADEAKVEAKKVEDKPAAAPKKPAEAKKPAAAPKKPAEAKPKTDTPE